MFAKLVKCGIACAVVATGFFAAAPSGLDALGYVRKVVSSQRSVQHSLDRAKGELERNAVSLRASHKEFERLKATRDRLSMQRARREQARDADVRILEYMRKTLEQRGSQIEVASGIVHARADVEADLERQLEVCREHDSRIREFDSAGAALDDGIRVAQASIREAEARLRDDIAKLRELQVAAKVHAVQEQVRELIDRCTPEAILKNDRAFDHEISRAELQMEELGTPRSLARVAGWRRWALAQEDKDHDLANIVDRYLETRSGPAAAQ